MVQSGDYHVRDMYESDYQPHLGMPNKRYPFLSWFEDKNLIILDICYVSKVMFGTWEKKKKKKFENGRI